ncbi:MAG: hypothetical protein ACRC5H_04630 [Treponemataceae bacterium]
MILDTRQALDLADKIENIESKLSTVIEFFCYLDTNNSFRVKTPSGFICIIDRCIDELKEVKEKIHP